jgi:hypothetical protein
MPAAAPSPPRARPRGRRAARCRGRPGGARRPAPARASPPPTPPSTRTRRPAAAPNQPPTHPPPQSWNAAWKKYHENIWKLNPAYDRELRYSAVSRNLVLQHIEHTPVKSVSDHVAKVILANRKVYDALAPDSKRLLIWQVKPALQ